MAPIPKNNLRERLQKLGYNPNLAKIQPPTLDNSKVIYPKKEVVAAPAPVQSSDHFDGGVSKHSPAPNFQPPVITNIDDWSDFEED